MTSTSDVLSDNTTTDITGVNKLSCAVPHYFLQFQNLRYFLQNLNIQNQRGKEETFYFVTNFFQKLNRKLNE